MRRSFRIPAVLLACAAAQLGVTSMATAAPAGGEAAGARTPFDLQGHRGARGLRPENTLPAFAKALELGVTTLELDTGLTRDGVVVVSHERRIATLECRDTAPTFPGDPAYPYVGKLIKDLTYAQIRTLDCGTRTPADPAGDPFVRTQEPVPGTRMPTLRQVFDLADRYGADDVRFNLETKLDPTLPEETFGPWRFATAVMRVIRTDGKLRRSSIQSFDWRTLQVARRQSRLIDLVALVEPKTVQAGVAGPSPWLAGLDVDDPRFGGDVARAARHIGANVLSPTYGTGAWGTPAFAWYLTPDMIASAHRLGLEVVPWTVNEPRALREVLTLAIDGIITDYPDRARAAMVERGLPLPRSYEAP